MCQYQLERKRCNRYSAEFKAKLALEVLKGNRTLAEIASDAQVHPNLLMQWKKQLLESLPHVFADKRAKENKEQEEKEAHLYQQIGQLKVELDWLKKKWDASLESKRRLVEAAHPEISLVRQCQLLGLSRSGFYYQPRPESELNLALMRLIDKEYTAHPFLGNRKRVGCLRQQGHPVNKKRVARLMQVMGLAAMVPGPNTRSIRICCVGLRLGRWTRCGVATLLTCRCPAEGRRESFSSPLRAS